MIIKLTNKQIENLMTMLFVGSITFKDKLNQARAEQLRRNIAEQYEENKNGEI